MLTLAKLRMMNEVLPTLPVICKESGINYNSLIKRMNRLSPELSTVESIKLKAEIDRKLNQVFEIINGNEDEN